MATWHDLSTYVRRNYNLDSEGPDFFKLTFTINNERTQSAYVRYVTDHAGTEWAHIDSVIGRMGDVDTVSLLREVENLACGGLALVGDFVTLRHSVLLFDMSVDEFEKPLRGVLGVADELEGRVSFQDVF